MAVASLQIIDTFHTKTARSMLHVKICVQHLPGRFLVQLQLLSIARLASQWQGWQWLVIRLRRDWLRRYDKCLALLISHYRVVICSDNFLFCSFHVEGAIYQTYATALTSHHLILRRVQKRELSKEKEVVFALYIAHVTVSILIDTAYQWPREGQKMINQRWKSHIYRRHSVVARRF